MKTNHRLMVKIVSLLLLALMIGVFTQCVATNTKQIGNSSSQNSSHLPPTKNQDAGQIINQTQVSEGIKNHEQILYTMSTLTGVPTSGSVMTVYNQVATTLPTDNDVKVFLPPHQLAITKLAAEFCHVLVDNATLRSNIWRNYNGFNQSPASGLDISNRDLIIDEVIGAFWGDVVTDAERDQAVDELHQLMDDMLAGEANNSGTTRNVIKGVCTSVLSSAHVTLL